MNSSKKNLISIFYDTLKPSVKKERKSNAFNVKPSAAGTKCLRKLYYSTLKVPEDFDVPENVKKMGKMGDGIGHILSNAYRDQGILIDYVKPNGAFEIFRGVPNLEFPISCPELGIKRGLIDAVLIMNNELWLGEYKSCTNNSFIKLRGAKPPHLVQGIIYLFVFNKLLKEGAFKHIKALDGFTEAKGMRFLYVNRDRCVDFLMKEFVVPISSADANFKSIVNMITTLLTYTNTETLPPKTPEWCSTCAWRLKCDNEYNI